jgi:hypothetical protein
MHDTNGTNRPSRVMGAAGALALALLALSGCSSTAGPETGADVEDVQQDVIEGTVDDADDAEEGDRVIISANVNDIISPLSFTIAGTDETTVDALLVIHDGKISGVEPGLTVQVTGIVHRDFDVAAAEKETGLDLDGALHEQWQGETYIAASQIDATVGSG